jgi:hypothetical protein
MVEEMTRLTLLLLASFVIQWQVQPGVQYVVERNVAGVYRPVDTFTGTSSEIPAISGVYAYKGRALNGVIKCGETINVLYLDWSVDHQTSIIFEGRGSLPLTLVKVVLPAKEWECTYSFRDSVPEFVRCKCLFDVIGPHGIPDGKVNLSDFVSFGTEYLKHPDLSKFADFGACYGDSTRIFP